MPRYTSLRDAYRSSPDEDQMSAARVLGIQRLQDYTARELAVAIVRVADMKNYTDAIRERFGIPFYEDPTADQVQEFVLSCKSRQNHPTARRPALVSA